MTEADFDPKLGQRVIFFGTPQFAANILDYLLQNKVNIVAIVTKPDKGRGRFQKISSSPVKLLAENHQIPLFQPLKARDPEFIKVLKELHPDVFVVAAYSEIFNEELLKLPPKGCINVHASLLPKYRGAAPIERCVVAGDKESGVTIMEMVRELDAGDMMGVAKALISPDMTAGELSEILSKIGGEALLKVLRDIEKNSSVRIPQDHSQATYAAKLKAEEGEIDWKKPALDVYNHIRGMTPKPGAFNVIEVKGEKKRLLIKKAFIESQLSGEPGAILPETGLVIACGWGALRLLEVQLEGKNALPINDFLRGIPKEKISFKIK